MSNRQIVINVRAVFIVVSPFPWWPVIPADRPHFAIFVPIAVGDVQTVVELN